MATLKDIAKALGLSVSTVSRSLNDHPSISQKTKDLVKKQSEKMNYSLNSIAKSLSDNKAYTITLLVDIDDEQSFQNPFFYEIMHGIEKFVYDKEYNLIIANTKTMIRKQSIIEWLINSKRTDGLILPSTVVNDQLVTELKLRNIPFVSIGEPVNIHSTVSWIDIDNAKGVEQAVKYLSSCGDQRIAFIGYDEQKLFSHKRLEGYKKGLSDLNIPLDESLIIPCDHTKEDGYLVTRQLLSKHTKVDAIICSDDNLSIGAIKAIREANLNIPTDLSMISFDNDFIAKLSYPEISTIKVDVFELGFQSAQLLFEQMEAEYEPQSTLIATQMILRETTK